MKILPSGIQMQEQNIFGLVLTGGKSTRMGEDKAYIEYHGKPQVEYVFDVLSVHCNKVFTSVFPGKAISERLNPLADQFEIKGPLNGILTALSHHPDNAWIIVAVDMPYVDERVIEQLIRERKPEMIATCFYNKAEKFPEPLLTLWEPKALPLLNKFVSTGKISPKEFLMENQVHLIIPKNKNVILNINSKEEYQDYKKST
jgi:molybdopterin-guanine dinucleotide biosynthesis protein A